MKMNRCPTIFLALLVALVCIMPSAVEALKCGTAITKDCLGDKDIRYDTAASNNLVDQANIWNLVSGLFIADAYYYGPDGQPLERDQNGFSRFPGKAFINITVAGSRFSVHQFDIFRNDVIGAGGCFTSDAWYTSTFEKDGSAQGLPIVMKENNSSEIFEATKTNMKIYPVDDRSYFGSGDSTSGMFIQYSQTCTDANCNNLLVSGEVISKDENGQPSLSVFVRNQDHHRVDENKWIEELNNALDDYNVPLDGTYPTTRPDLLAGCASGNCPTEEDWRTIDPNYNKSPYQEPAGSLTAGFISGITIASFIIVASIAYMHHRRIVAAREQGLKTSFARAIAATIDTRTSAQNLSHEDLKNEFDSIDIDKSGTISKEELHAFIVNSNVANLSDKDFDVLFATIDIDSNNGKYCCVYYISVEYLVHKLSYYL